MWWAPLRAFCIVNGVLYVTVNEWNDGMSYSIINYSYPDDKTPWMAKSGCGVGRLSLFLFLVSEQTFCGEPVDAFTVNWTALYFVFFIQWTFLIFFCIHCDRTAQEVACARHSKNKKKNLCFSFSFVCAAQFSFFFLPLLICQSDCTVCFESRIRKKPLSGSIPLSGSKTVWERMVSLFFSSLVQLSDFLMLLIWLKCSAWSY